MRAFPGYRLLLPFVVCCVFPIAAYGSDTIPAAEKRSHRWFTGNDTVHSPKRAAILSAILPGTGQAYNRKYWKMPLVYAAGIAGGYMIHSNAAEYQKYRKAYIQRMSDDPDPGYEDPFPFLSAQQLRVYRDVYRRDMELAVILTTAAYLLQILDATVDAHLFNFDVSNNLAVQWRPVFIPAAMTRYRGVGGVSLELRLQHSQHTKRRQVR
jgi:hypothetical protein